MKHTWKKDWRRASFVSLAASTAVAASLLVAPMASAEPATEGWRDGFCKEDEGLTVVVDFGVYGEGREFEARCKIGGEVEQQNGLTTKTAVEAVGYTVTDQGGLVTHIDGIGNDFTTGDYHYWHYSSSNGLGPWGGAFSLPDENVTNWFYGVCLSESGCFPRVDTQFAPTATAALTGSTTSQYGESAQVQVEVTSTAGENPEGTVTLSGGPIEDSAPVSNGAASFDLPADLPVGTYAFTATYDGGEAFGEATSESLSVTVTRGTIARPALKIRTRPTTKKRGKFSVVIRQDATLVGVTGKAVVIAKKGDKVKRKKASLQNGSATVTLAKLGKGKWKFVGQYRGSKTYLPATSAPKKIKVR